MDDSQSSSPVWPLVFIVFAVVGLFCGLDVFSRDPHKSPPYSDYTADSLLGAKWRWDWNVDGVTNLMCYCPECDMQLVEHCDIDESSNFICEHCNDKVVFSRKGPAGEAFNAATREILRRMRTEKLPQS